MMSLERLSLSPSPMVETRSMTPPRLCLSRCGRAYSLGRTPLSEGLSRSMAIMALSSSLPMTRVFGAALEVGPAGFGRYPENVVGGVFVAVFGVSAFFLLQRGVLFLEGVGDVFQEDEAEDDVFVFGGVEVAAEFVGSGPKRGFEAE